MPTKNSNFSISALRDITVKIPLNIDSDSVGYETLGENEIAEVINYNLKSILLTHPGELMDTSFGVGLRRFLFEQSVNPNLVGSLIESQISIYMPWLTNVEVFVFVDEQIKLSVSIKYKLNQPEIIDEFKLSLSLDEI